MGTHAKQQNPSRIQAQRVAIGSAEPVPFGHLRTRSKQRWMVAIGSAEPVPFGHLRTRSKQRWMDGAGRSALIEFSIRWARMRNSRTPAGFRPNGLPLGQQSRCRLGTFEPAQSKGGWMGLDAVAWVNFPSGGHACETAEPQQDSGPTGCHWVSRAGAVWAPSNPLKAKVDGWGWTLWPG